MHKKVGPTGSRLGYPELHVNVLAETELVTVDSCIYIY